MRYLLVTRQLRNCSNRRNHTAFALWIAPSLVAIPFPCHSLLHQVDKGRIFLQNCAVDACRVAARTPYLLQDFNDVFAAKLCQERHNSALGYARHPLNLALARVAFMVARLRGRRRSAPGVHTVEKAGNPVMLNAIRQRGEILRLESHQYIHF